MTMQMGLFAFRMLSLILFLSFFLPSSSLRHLPAVFRPLPRSLALTHALPREVLANILTSRSPPRLLSLDKQRAHVTAHYRKRAATLSPFDPNRPRAAPPPQAMKKRTCNFRSRSCLLPLPSLFYIHLHPQSPAAGVLSLAWLGLRPRRPRPWPPGCRRRCSPRASSPGP